MDLFYPKPADLLIPGRKRALQMLAGRFPWERDLGDRTTAANLRAYVDMMLEKIGEAGQGPFFNALIARAEPLRRISSNDWNEAQERVFIDLSAVYLALNIAGNEDSVRGELTHEEFINTRGAILRVINETRLFQFLKGNPRYQDAKFINFSSAVNEAVAAPRATVDPEVRLLELAPRARSIQSRRYASGRNIPLRETQISIENLGGGRSTGRNDEFSVDKMTDTRKDSFWAEMIMAESPIVQSYEPSGDAGLGTIYESQGALCHVTLEMSRVAQANTLRLLPFGEFPVRVVDVAYKESSGQEIWVMLPDFRVEDATLDWIEVNFDPRPIAALRITLEQVNYRSNLYHLPAKLVKRGFIWQHIGRSRKAEKLGELSLTAEEEDLVQVDPQQMIRLEAEEDFRGILEGKSLQQGRTQEFQVMKDTTEASVDALSKSRPTDANLVTTVVSGDERPGGDKTLEVRTYEYVYGLREAQLQHNLYQPLGHYQSEKYRSGATILSASLTTEELHPTFADGLGEYYRTSTEWWIEFGRDRRYAIAPRNWRGDDGKILVPDEYLQFDRLTRQAITRLSMETRAATLRKNGRVVPLSKYRIVEYEPQALTAGPFAAPGGAVSPGFRSGNGNPVVTNEKKRGLVTIVDPKDFDPNAVYTLQYQAGDGADFIDIDDELNSVELLEPETFEETNRDNQVLLMAFPYVDFSIVNSDLWTKVSNRAEWKFNPTKPNYTGTANVTNGSKSVVVSAGLSALDSTKEHVFRDANGVGAYLVDSIDSDTGLTLVEEYDGSDDSGVVCSVGERFESDGKIYALDKNGYQPVKVFVNDVLATNLTDYVAAEHQAFTDIPTSGRQYEFIQAGEILYFNRPIANAKIEVFYSWLTEYVAVKGVLRCNIPARTVLTPQVNSLRLELETSKL